MKEKDAVKLNELVQEEVIDSNELVNVTGGKESEAADGCVSGICSQKINTSYCEGGAVCTSGIAG